MQDDSNMSAEDYELFKRLNLLFKKYCGVPLTFLKYEIDNLSKRVEIIETTFKQTIPVMAATTIKVEAISANLCADNITSEARLSAFSKQILNSCNKEDVSKRLT